MLSRTFLVRCWAKTTFLWAFSLGKPSWFFVHVPYAMWLLLICGLAARRVPRILSPCSNSLSLSLSFILSLSLIRSLSLSLLKRSRIGVKRSRSHRQVFILSSVTLSCSWSFCFCVCILSFFLCNPFVSAFSQLSVLSLTLCKMLSISCLYLGVKSLAIFMLWFYSHLSHRGQVESFFAALAWCRFTVRCCMLGLCDVAVVAKPAVHCNAEVRDGSCLFAYPLSAAKSLTFSKLDYSSLAWC